MDKSVKIDSFFIDKRLKTRALNKGDYFAVHHFPNINPVKRSAAEAPPLQEKISYNPFNSSKGLKPNKEQKEDFHIGSFIRDKAEKDYQKDSFIEKKSFQKDSFIEKKGELSFEKGSFLTEKDDLEEAFTLRRDLYLNKEQKESFKAQSASKNDSLRINKEDIKEPFNLEKNDSLLQKDSFTDLKGEFAFQKEETGYFMPDKGRKSPPISIKIDLFQNKKDSKANFLEKEQRNSFLMTKNHKSPIKESADPLKDVFFPLERESTGSFIFDNRGEHSGFKQFLLKNEGEREILRLKKENEELKEMFLLKERDYLEKIEDITKEVISVKSDYKTLESKVEFLLKEKDELIEKLQTENPSKSYKGKENSLLAELKLEQHSINNPNPIKDLPNDLPKKPTLLTKRPKLNPNQTKTPLQETN